MSEMYEIPPHIETRWASAENPTGERGAAASAGHGRKGAPFAVLPAGGETVIASATGPGTVRRIWITVPERSPAILRGAVIRAYWDGESKPAISAPLGDFFGVALGRTAPFEAAYFDSPEGRSFNCRFPMPFRHGMRLVVANESPVDISMLFYQVDYTLGDRHGEDAGYFHAHFRRESPTVFQRDFEILPRVAGRGRYLGATVGVIADRSRYLKTWWGEGEVKVYLDGDGPLPTLAGTGTEDYICTGWGQGRYALAWYGCPVADEERMEYSFYRLHGPDPVYFQREARVTIQQIGCYDRPQAIEILDSGLLDHFIAPGDGSEIIDREQVLARSEYHLFEREDDWSATAYFYLDRPVSDLPPIAGYEERVKGLAGG